MNAENAYMRLKESVELYNDLMTACEAKNGDNVKLREIAMKVTEVISTLKRVTGHDVHQSNDNYNEPAERQRNAGDTVDPHFGSGDDTAKDGGNMKLIDLAIAATTETEFQPRLTNLCESECEEQLKDSRTEIEMQGRRDEREDEMSSHKTEEQPIYELQQPTTESHLRTEDPVTDAQPDTHRKVTPEAAPSRTNNDSPAKTENNRTLKEIRLTYKRIGRTTPKERFPSQSHSSKSAYHQGVMPVADELSGLETKVWDWLLKGGKRDG